MRFIGTKKKKLIALLSAAAMLILAPGLSSFTSHADDPVTYSARFNTAENDWTFQQGSTYDESLGQYYSRAYLLTILKDGDSIVVYAEDGGFHELHLGDVKLANLTVHNNAQAAVVTGGVNECYILAGAFCSVNGDVRSASLYDNTTCTFNDNVAEMTLYFSDSAPSSNISCGGTVGHFAALGDWYNGSYYNFYNVSAGALVIENGASKVPYYAYSPEPGTDNQQPADQASPDQTSPASSSDDDEYDHVPKTGEAMIYPWLFLASVLCFAGSIILRKKETR